MEGASKTMDSLDNVAAITASDATRETRTVSAVAIAALAVGNLLPLLSANLSLLAFMYIVASLAQHKRPGGAVNRVLFDVVSRN